MPFRIVAANYGGPEVLEKQPFESIALGEHDVRVEVRTAGVNPYDVKSYSGVYFSDSAKLPLRLGSEAAGIVTEIGSAGIHGPHGPISVGDEVIVFRTDEGYASELVVHSASILPRPPSITWEQAGSMMVTGVTAAHCLTATDVKEGETVLIHGASGGVGLTAVQLAVLNGARVLATASESQHEILRELGATPVVYGEGLLKRMQALAPAGIAAAIDLAGTDEALDVSLALVGDRQRIATIANFTSAPQAGVQVLRSAKPEEIAIRDTSRMPLVELAGKGQLKLFVENVYSVDEVATAHKEIATGHTHGKLVLTF
jgi:NADPH:quinone reductase-like Zn-dependent oxidoreductase